LALPIGLPEDHLPLSSDEDDGAREVLASEGLLEDFIEMAEVFTGDPGLFGPRGSRRSHPAGGENERDGKGETDTAD